MRYHRRGLSICFALIRPSEFWQFFLYAKRVGCVLIVLIFNRKVDKTLRKAGLEALTSTSTSSSSSHREQPHASSSVLQCIGHPIQKNKRRPSDTPPGDNRMKRPRSEPLDDDADDEVIIIDDPTGPSGGRQEKIISKPQTVNQQNNKTKLSPEDKLNIVDTVNFFKLDPKALGYIRLYLSIETC